MNLTQISNRKWIYHIIAFLIPFIGMLIFMLIGECVPFGRYSMLYSDMYHQYFPFFKAFRRALLSGDSLLYNWDVGLGLDYLGLYSYYLASPLNLLSVLVPESWVLGYFSLLVPIKLGLASMFFGIFLKKISGKQDYSNVLFGSFYGLCAWALGYQWNIMWLDTFALLPLVMTGMISLLKERKFILYTITLFLSIYTNYYIGFFTCIFVLLTFICYEICRWKGFSSLIADLSRIAIFSILAIGMTAIISLPTLAALQTTQSSVNTFPEGFNLNMTTDDNWFGLFKTMAKVAGNTYGGIAPTFKEGLPNLYCGVFTLILSILYLFCNGVKIRDKICAIVLLIFFNISFIFRQLDYIWHGFHFTNMIPYRFSFLYSFVMLYMAYIAWNKRRQFRIWQIIVSAIPAIGMLFLCEEFEEITFWAFNGATLLLYFSVLICMCSFRPAPSNPDKEQIATYVHARSAKKTVCSGILLGIMAIEIGLNFANFGSAFPLTDTKNYPKGTADSEAVIEYMQEQEKDNPFYRAEVTHTQTFNDGALNGYHGVTTFTSSANVKVTEFMQVLGYGAKNTYNRYSYEESSPVANLFLGLKYMIERDDKVESNSYFDEVYSSDRIHLLKNNAYLPLGFLANAQLLNVDFNIKENHFDFQNQLIKEATGTRQNVWYQIPGTMLTISSDGPEITPQASTGYCLYTTTDDAGTITYSYTADRSGFVCVDLDLSKRNSFYIYVNNNLLYNETYSLPQMASVCGVKPGDVVQIKLKCNKSEKGTIKIKAAILKEDVFRNAHETLSESVLNIDNFSNTKIGGTINCKHNGVLYTSIPQNGNWNAVVDGKPADTVTIGDAMVGLLLSEGTHTIQFVYRNPSFSLGWKVSLGCFIIFIVIAVTIYKPTLQRKKGKYEK